MRIVILWLGLAFTFSGVMAQSYVKSSFSTKTARNAETFQTLTFDGSWCWFSDPRAVYYEGDYKRTYAGWIDSYGDVAIGYFDHATGEIKSKVIHDGLEVDDHDNPSILFDAEGYLIVTYNLHGGGLFMTRSISPESIEQWEESMPLPINDREKYDFGNNGYTYTNPIRLSDENNRLFLFWRGIDGKPTVSISDDNGESWSKGKIFFMPERTYGFRRPYVKYYADDKSRIHISLTDGHPRNEATNSIYYMYYENGGFYKADGTKIGDLDGDPIKPSDCDKVYDATLSKQKAWIWDIAADAEGKPVLAYAKFPDDENHIYSYAQWDGSSWFNYDLINAGGWFPKTAEGTVEKEPNYSGGMNIDKEEVNKVYLSVRRDSVFEIEEWSYKKNPSKWSAKALTDGSSKDNIRPFAIRGATSELQVMWMTNSKYTHYTDYQSSIQTNLLPEGLSDDPDSSTIANLMIQVADWQLMNPRKYHKMNWHYGAFYTGIWETYQKLGLDRYRNEIYNIGQFYDWQLISDIYHADRLTIAQPLTELYLEEKDEEMIDKIQWAMDIHVDRKPKADVRFKDNPYHLEWWTWCDALYMAPPAFARVAKATGEGKYLDYLDKHWWITSDYLYSSEDSLFYRDDRFFDQSTENGKKIFWSRGNGWVIAGLARLIPYLPEDFATRDKYVQQYKEMAEKLRSIQGDDGLWRVSLVDPEYLNIGESSGSSFFVFALLWGINNGILSDDIYGPAAVAGWKALANNVNEVGRLGFVQQVAGSPYPFYEHESHVYAAGAFLQACSEMITYLKDKE
ncbi:MAG: glycoside hydrolase family 88 protein [Cyclobacteriaceae bacterium]